MKKEISFNDIMYLYYYCFPLPNNTKVNFNTLKNKSLNMNNAPIRKRRISN